MSHSHHFIREYNTQIEGSKQQQSKKKRKRKMEKAKNHNHTEIVKISQLTQLNK